MYICICVYIGINITITNGPQDTIVCINDTAKINCGYAGANPTLTMPNWVITNRSSDGSIINTTYTGFNLINGSIDGLLWSPDLTSGDENATNSKLLVGPVNNTHNQSSYQCIFPLANRLTINSSVGTVTVVGKTTV